jgi:NAD-dependent dihydropyrimidine dehydrogenase PreA subunit
VNLFLPAGEPPKLKGWRRPLAACLSRLGPTWRAAPFRRLLQCFCLALYGYCSFVISWPYGRSFVDHPLAGGGWPPVEAFLWIDPLVGLSTAIAARWWNVALAGTAFILAFGLLFPRGFCGYLCPLGTLLDLFDGVVGRRIRPRQARPPRHGSHLRFYLLAAVLIASVFGVLLSGVVAPLPMLTRGLAFSAGRLELGLLKNWGMVTPLTPAGWVSLGLFAGVFLLSLFGRRFWCRHVCPSGALVSLGGLLSRSERRVNHRCVACGQCVEQCAFGAVQADFSSGPLDCAFCQTCAGLCPSQAIEFRVNGRRDSRPTPEGSPRAPHIPRGAQAELGDTPHVAGEQATSHQDRSPEAGSDQETKGQSISRRQALLAGLGGGGAALLMRFMAPVTGQAVRPPGSVDEERFLDLCIRCEQCLQVCPGPVLQAAGVEHGLEALWTPQAVFTHAGCHQDCNFCTQVCPTGAIQPLTLGEKRHTRLGWAVIDASCLPHRGERDCRLCVDECNAAGYRAIEMRPVKLAVGQAPEGTFSPSELEAMSRIEAPFVNKEACVGCGLCEYRCQSVNVRQRHLLGRSAIVVVAETRRTDPRSSAARS